VFGGELDIELRINEVYASAAASYLSGQVKGLSGGQLVVAIGFRGGIDLAGTIPTSGKQDKTGGN
jgi:hypothetical protein